MRARLIAFNQHRIPKLQSVSSFLFYSHPILWFHQTSLVDRPRNLVAKPLHLAMVKKGNFICASFAVMRRICLRPGARDSLRVGAWHVCGTSPLFR